MKLWGKCFLVLFLLCLTILTSKAQDEDLQGRIEAGHNALSKYDSTLSLDDLQRSLKSLVLIHLPVGHSEEQHLEEVTRLWLGFFERLDASYDSSFDVNKRPTLLDMPHPSLLEAQRELEEEANRELLEKSAHYWHLQAIDLNATSAVGIFIRVHHPSQRQQDRLRNTAISAGLSPQRVERVFSKVNNR